MSQQIGFGPAIHRALDEAFLRDDRVSILDYAHRAAVLCTLSVQRGDIEDARAFAEAHDYCIRLTAESQLNSLKRKGLA